MSEDAFDKSALLHATQAIVAAHLSNNQVPTSDVPGLIHAVMLSLTTAPVEEAPKEPLKPAVPISRSVAPDAITCLECGVKFKSMKRHLSSHHGMSPDDYRLKWGLPKTYPMVAPSYAKARSTLALTTGLGRRKPVAQAAE